jgi:protein O-mannosyl-transferase
MSFPWCWGNKNEQSKFSATMKKLMPYSVLTLAVFLVYGNTLFHSFHFDDIPSILEKPWIRGLDKIPEFICSVWQRPLVILSFNINYAISGFEVWSYHVFNILFHTAATFLVYHLAGLAVRVFSQAHPQSSGRWNNIAILSALLFALHPLSTQSVTYISSRSSILVTVFYLAALILFFKGLLKVKEDSKERSNRTLYGVIYWGFAGMCFVLGMVSKQIIVTLPAMMFLFHYYFLSSESFPQWLVRQAKWLLLVGLPLVGAIIYKQFWGGGVASASHAPWSTSTYLLTQTFVVPFEYFRKLLFPFNLSIDVAFPVLSEWSNWANWMGVVVLLLYVGLCVYISRDREASMTRRLAGFAMAWVLITLLPTSSFVPLLDVTVEHRIYLPMVGFSLLLAGLLVHFANEFKLSAKSSTHFGNGWIPVVWTCAVLILICFATGAVKRNAVWKDEVSLWADAKKKAPNLVRPYNNLGEAYDRQGKYDLAIKEFEAAIQLSPGYFFGLNNLGNVYGKKKNYPKAIHYFKKALAQKPDYAPAYYNLARALHLVGKPQDALGVYRQAIRFNPYFEQAFFNLANLALQSGLLDESIANFLRFLKMQPDHARARFGLGNAYAMQGQFDKAYAEFEQSALLDPEFVFPEVNMANIQMQKGNVDQAIDIYSEVLARKPKLAGIHKNLGMIYYQFKKDADKAVFHFKESLRLEPQQPQAPILQGIVADVQKKK